jgi:sec-independent protein translocase protein TatA
MFGSVGTGELMVIFFVIFLVFGKDKLPDLARTVAKVIRQFQKAVNDVKDEINIDEFKRDLKG